MAGAGYKLFNTGDVLTAAQVNTYLMEQTVMVFADAAARTTALTGVVSEGMISYLKDTNAVEVYNGSAWVASDDPNAIQNTIVDAKGDLITATAADTPARLAVGNNGETLLADSSATTGLRWSATPSASNPILNSAMDIWQRGTSLASTGGVYTADRWQISGSNNYTVSRQATGDTTNLPFIQYCARVQRNSGSTDTATVYFVQSMETANSIPFVGKTITFSYYARRGADFTGASNQIGVQLFTGTGTDQNVQSGFTGAAAVIDVGSTLTTTWQRFTHTATIAGTVTQFAPRFYMTGVGTAGTNDYYEITGVQIDVGNVALPFRRAGGTLAGELQAAQRYYQKSYAQTATVPTNTTTVGVIYGNRESVPNGIVYGNTRFPVIMRQAPTITIYSYTTSQTGRVSNEAGTDQGANSALAVAIGDAGFNWYNNSGGTLTLTNGWIAHYSASAEL